MKKILVLVFAIFYIGGIANAQWQPTNGPYGGGSVFCFAMNGSNIFAGTEFNGVFLSTNNGSNWIAVNNGLTNLNIKALIVIGTNIYAGTYGGGVFVSTNNGNSWTTANTGLTHTYITSFAVSGSNFYAGTMGGVFLSTNNGSSWTAINNGINKYIYSIAASGSNVYAGTDGGVYKSTNSGSTWSFYTVSYGDIVNSIAFCGNFIFAATLGHGVYVSSNGSSWSVSTPYPGYIYNIYTLAVSGTNIYAGTGGGFTGGSILFSSNGGANWVTLKDSIFVQSLLISGSNIFAGTTKGVYLTANNGSNWSVTNNGLINNSVSLLASNGTNIFAGTFLGGVFRSINNGASWTETSYLSNVTSLTFNDTIIYAGTGGGVLKSANYGNSWTFVASGGTNQVNTIVVKGSNIFAGTNFGVFLIANGSGWTPINNGLTTLLVRSLVLNGNDIIAGTAGGVFLSSNNGSSWISINNGLTNLNIKTLAVSGTNIFAGTAGGVFLSSDSGSSWTAINNGLTNLNIQSLIVSDSNVFVSTNSGVFFSSNYGNTWTAANNGLINNVVQSFAVCGANVFAGTNGNGVWKNSSFLCSYPTIPASGFTISNVTAYSTTIGWTRGNGNRTIVLSKAGSAVNSNPFDGNFYPANSIFGNGTQIGNGNYVIYNGTDTSINITGLSAGTNYYFAVYEFDTTSNCYLSNALTGNLTTICIPLSIIVQPVSLQSSCLPSSNIIFNVKVSGNSTSAYQWQYYNGTTWNSVANGMPTGAVYINTTADSMTVSGITAAGTYQYRCYISNCNGVNTVTSNISTLIVSPLPNAAATITGSSTVCQGQNNVVYTVSPIANATSYIWTLPTGAIGNSSANTITVNYGYSAFSGNITVKGNNSCGVGAISSLPISVNPLPSSASLITGTTNVAAGQQNVQYYIPAIANATSYLWTLPNGASGASITNTISVNYSSSAVSGNIIVKGINSCGIGDSTSLYITVNPFIPNCSAQFDLVADTTTPHHYFAVNNASGIPPLQYNWSWGDGTFSTTAYPTHTYSTSGNYKICLTIIDSVGCTTTYCDSSYLQKDPNAIISVQVIPQGTLGISNLSTDKINIYPNPAKENLIIELIESNISQKTIISIYNIQGQLCRQIISNQPKNEIDIKDLSTGLYVIKLNNEKETFQGKFVKE